MNIVIGSDHRGFMLKERIKGFLFGKNYNLIDVGTDNGNKAVDYPVYAQKVAKTIIDGKAEKGILICGSGIGVCIAANRFKGIRAATVRGPATVEMAIRHNNANVLCLGANFTGLKKSKFILDRFFHTEFEGGRHQRRLDLIEKQT